MCGIIGFASARCTDEQHALLHKLVIQSSVRGLHAFGAAWPTKDGVLATRKWRRLPDPADLPGVNALIYHCRYSTSGDWHDDNNNQPITAGKVSAAVNGVLSMKPRQEYEVEYDVRCTTGNDAEIFVRLLLAGNDPVAVVRQLRGSIAAVFLWQGSVFAVRNDMRPLYWFRAAGAVYVVSTADIADRATGIPVDVHVVKPYTLFDLSAHV